MAETKTLSPKGIEAPTGQTGHEDQRQVSLLEKPCYPVLDQTPSSWPDPSIEKWNPTVW